MTDFLSRFPTSPLRFPGKFPDSNAQNSPAALRAARYSCMPIHTYTAHTYIHHRPLAPPPTARRRPRGERASERRDAATCEAVRRTDSRLRFGVCSMCLRADLSTHSLKISRNFSPRCARSDFAKNFVKFSSAPTRDVAQRDALQTTTGLCARRCQATRASARAPATAGATARQPRARGTVVTACAQAARSAA